jgi:hypothetical protein
MTPHCNYQRGQSGKPLCLSLQSGLAATQCGLGQTRLSEPLILAAAALIGQELADSRRS